MSMYDAIISQGPYLVPTIIKVPAPKETAPPPPPREKPVLRLVRKL